MKWTDQEKLTLLLKVIADTPNLTIDAEKISRTWPSEDKPSPRVVRERFCALKKYAVNGERAESSHYPVSEKKKRTGQSMMLSTKSSPEAQREALTPERNGHTASGLQTPSTGSRAGRKRQRLDDDEEDEAVSSGAESESGSDVIVDSPSRFREYPRRSTRATKPTMTTTATAYNGYDSDDQRDGIAGDLDSDDSDSEFDIWAEREAARAQRPTELGRRWMTLSEDSN